MSGYYGDPFRAPADGWGVPSPIFYLASPAQHRKPALMHVPKYSAEYGNVIQPDESAGDPYYRIVRVPCGDDVLPSCDPELGLAALIENGCPHAPWVKGTDAGVGYGDGEYKLADFPAPTFTAAGEVDLSACRIVGYKNVQSRRQWHGVFGFLTPDACNDASVTCGETTTAYRSYKDTPDQTKFLKIEYDVQYIGSSMDLDIYRPDFYAADTSAYTAGDIDSFVSTITSYAASISAHTQFVVGNGVRITGSNQVNPESGVVAFGVHVKNLINHYYGGSIYGHIENLDGVVTQEPYITTNVGNWIGAPSAPEFLVFPKCDTHPFSTLVPPGISIDPSAASGDCDYYYDAGLGEYVAGTPSFDPNDYDLGYRLTYRKIQWDKTNTGYSFKDIAVEMISDEYSGVRFWNNSDGIGLIFINMAVGTITLSEPNTADDVQDDMDLLEDAWDLNDDIIYPWRTDGNTTIAPVVARWEVRANVSPFTESFQPYYVADEGEPSGYRRNTDPNAEIFDGSIIGRPLRSQDYGHAAGGKMEGWFAPLMPKWELFPAETCGPGQPPFWELLGWGEFNTGQFGLPTAATYWTNALEAAAYTAHGVFLSYGATPFMAANYVLASDGAFRHQKWAEVKLNWKSYDFNQPYGRNKFLTDQSRTYVVATEDMDEITVFRTENGPSLLDPPWWPDEQAAPEDGDLVAVKTGSKNGVYIVGSVDGTLAAGSVADGDGVVSSARAISFVVGTKVSDLPDWFPANSAGVLRFNDNLRADWESVAPFGLVRITGITSDGVNYTLTFAEPLDQWLGVDGSLPTFPVDFYEAKFNASTVQVPKDTVAASGTLTKVTNTTATVPVSVGDLSDVKWLIATGQKPWWWDDGLKGSYCIARYELDQRTEGEALRLDGLNCGENFPDTPWHGVDGKLYNADTTRNYGCGDFSITGYSIKFTPCCPTVICFSNNGETWPNGRTFEIRKVQADETYGTFYQEELIQAMTHPLWQRPHKPYLSNCGEPAEFNLTKILMVPDDGGCQVDEDIEDPLTGCHLYRPRYAFPTQCEPFFDLPATNSTTAPDPMDLGIAWKVYSPVDHDPTVDLGDGHVLLAPLALRGHVGFGYNDGIKPWQFWLNACATIAADDCAGHETGENFVTKYQSFVNC